MKYSDSSKFTIFINSFICNEIINNLLLNKHQLINNQRTIKLHWGIL